MEGPVPAFIISSLAINQRQVEQFQAGAPCQRLQQASQLGTVRQRP